MTIKTFRDINSRHSPAEIIRQTAAFFCTTPKAIIGQRRTGSLIVARHVAMYLMREHTGHTLAEIGERIGFRDHTTVIHGVRSTMRCMNRDETLRRQIHLIEEKLAEAEPKEVCWQDREMENLQGLA